ncbi:hypothetical protein M3914_003377 [Vibrio metschnikovii]|nr:hypothetical protein [Vibrio metschnikovii]
MEKKVLLEKTGRALYGERWQSDLARDLKLDSRRIRQWLSDDRPIPDGVVNDLKDLLQERRSLIDDVIKNL